MPNKNWILNLLRSKFHTLCWGPSEKRRHPAQSAPQTYKSAKNCTKKSNSSFKHLTVNTGCIVKIKLSEMKRRKASTALFINKANALKSLRLTSMQSWLCITICWIQNLLSIRKKLSSMRWQNKDKKMNSWKMLPLKNSTRPMPNNKTKFWMLLSM